jgi:hypothetical protein
MTKFEKLLAGGDLRSIGKSNSVVSKIQDQNDFDELINCLFQKDRIIVMRAVDAIEKLTIKKPLYLAPHKRNILELSNTAIDKELKWHLALLIPRLRLNKKELNKVWDVLTKWAMDKTNSRIVRVNSIQGLFELTKQNPDLLQSFSLILFEMEKENISSVNARIRKIRRQIDQE